MKPRWRKVARDLSSHRLRTTLVVLSIAIGIFAVGVVLGTRQVLLREFAADFRASVPADATFRALDFDEDLVREVAAASTVERVQPRRSVTVPYELEGHDRERLISLESFPDFDDIRVGKVVPLDEAPWPPARGEIVLEAAALQVAEFEIGDELYVETQEGERVTLVVAGFAHDINAVPAQFLGFETGYVSVDTMRVLGQPDGYNQLAVTYEGDDPSWAEASRRARETREDSFEAAGVRVLYTDVPEPGSHFLGDIFAAVSLLLLALGVLALGLSAFLVVNTVSSLMAQQVRQVGIMKAIGAEASQLERLYAGMVAVYGALGVAIGLPAALVGARWFTDFAAEILNFRVLDHALPAWVIAVQVAVGLLVPLASAAVPVRSGVRMSVVAALNPAMGGASFGHSAVDRVLGAIRGLPRPVALALRNTFLRKGRLLLTLSTLALASAVVISVFGVRSSIERTIDDLESWWRYDAQVTFEGPQDPLVVEEALADVPALETFETWPSFNVTLVRGDGTENESFTITGLDPDTDLIGPIVVDGRWLADGVDDEIVVNTDALGADPSIGVGSELTLDVLGERRTWRVVGVVKGQLGGPAVYCDREALDALTGTPGVTRLIMRGERSSPEAQQQLLDDAEDQLRASGIPVASARTRAGLADQVRRQLGILVSFLIIMAALLASVGVIGLTGSMTINVLESTREIGVMRATGAQHRSIYQIFLTEGMTVGALAWAIGAVLSYPLSYALVGLLATAIGVPLSYSFSWTGMGAWLGLMLVIAAAASLAPAYRATRVSVRDAIAYE